MEVSPKMLPLGASKARLFRHWLFSGTGAGMLLFQGKTGERNDRSVIGYQCQGTLTSVFAPKDFAMDGDFSA